jgi:hypothetical protein
LLQEYFSAAGENTPAIINADGADHTRSPASDNYSCQNHDGTQEQQVQPLILGDMYARSFEEERKSDPRQKYDPGRNNQFSAAGTMHFAQGNVQFHLLAPVRSKTHILKTRP